MINNDTEDGFLPEETCGRYFIFLSRFLSCSGTSSQLIQDVQSIIFRIKQLTFKIYRYRPGPSAWISQTMFVMNKIHCSSKL